MGEKRAPLDEKRMLQRCSMMRMTVMMTVMMNVMMNVMMTVMAVTPPRVHPITQS